VDNADALKRDLGESMFRALDLGSILQNSISAEKFSDKLSSSNFGKIQGCHIFHGKTYLTGKNIPNEHKMCPNGFNIFHMAVKYS
jgi:hypothetical protein